MAAAVASAVATAAQRDRGGGRVFSGGEGGATGGGGGGSDSGSGSGGETAAGENRKTEKTKTENSKAGTPPYTPTCQQRTHCTSQLKQAPCVCVPSWCGGGGGSGSAVYSTAWCIATGVLRVRSLPSITREISSVFADPSFLKRPVQPSPGLFYMEREGGYKGASLVLQTKHPKNTENCDFGSRLQRITGHYTTPTKCRGHHYCTKIVPQTRIGEVERPSTRDNEFQRVIKCLLQSCHRELTNVSPSQCL